MKLIGTRRRGFLLGEAIIALMVSILTILMMQLCLQLISKSSQLNVRDNIRMHVVEARIQSILKDKTVYVDSDNQRLYYSAGNDSQGESDIKSFERTDQYLRQKDEHGGFEPVLNNVKRFNILKKSKSVQLTIVDSSNRVTEMFISDITFAEKKGDLVR